MTAALEQVTLNILNCANIIDNSTSRKIDDLAASEGFDITAAALIDAGLQTASTTATDEDCASDTVADEGHSLNSQNSDDGQAGVFVTPIGIGTTGKIY